MRLLKHMAGAKSHVSLVGRVRAWSHGFVPDSYVIYNLGTNNPREYVSDYAQLVQTPVINHDYRIVLNDKILFREVLHRFAEHLPRLYCVLRGDTVRALDEQGAINCLDAVLDLCERNGALVVKPVIGCCGRGIMVLSTHADTWRLNGTETSRTKLASTLAGQAEACLVSEHVAQANYAATIFPHATNSIRLLTMWNAADDAPFLAAAVHRFGTPATIPADNWSRGGLSAAVDLMSGELGPGVAYPRSKRLRWHNRHPDSGAALAGTVVPRWSQTVAHLLEIARSVPFLPCVGWDVVVTEESFKLIEGNAHSDLNLLQVHGPLLKNPRVRAFYEQQRVIRAR
ncbi:MAG: hypothetical protein KKB50_19010 [Planctomycetes bacterium]|nr:hypothetical protein [Planctomycetota bacterium]